MTVCFEQSNVPIVLAPLTRALSDCQVGGMTFASAQRRACENAGLTVVESDGDVTVMANAWISSASLKQLCEADAPCVGLVGGQMAAYRGSVHGVSTALNEAVIVRYPWDLLAVQEFLLTADTPDNIQGEVHSHAVVEGVLQLGKGSRILPGVFIEGVAIIGDNCKVGPNAYLRGSITIGDHSYVGQAVEIKNSIIGMNVAMGHLSYCGDSIIGDGVNFGAGTIISNFRHDRAHHRSMVGTDLVDTGRSKFGAIIGDGVNTGIHSSIYPGRKVWPGAMTFPGEVVRKDILSPNHKDYHEVCPCRSDDR